MNLAQFRALRDHFFSALPIARHLRELGTRFTHDLIATAGANLGIALFGALAGVLVARILGVEGRGELATAVVWVAVVQVVFSAGLPQAFTYSVAEEPERIGSIFVTGLVLCGIQSVLSLGIVQVVLIGLVTQSRSIAVGAISVYLFSVPFSLLTTYLTTMAQGLKRFDLFNAPRVASLLIYVLALFCASALHLHKAGEVILVLLGVQIAVALTSLAWFCLQIRPRGRFEWKLARSLVRYGLRSYLGNLSWMANARLDQFIMSAFVDLQVLGLYAVAVSYSSVLFPLSGAFAMILFPTVVSSTQDVAKHNIGSTLKLNAALSGIGALALGLLAPVLLPLLFGDGFYPSVGPTRVLLAGSVLLGSNYVLSDSLRGLGFPLLPSIAELLGFAVTAGSLPFMLSSLGMLGAAWTSLLSYGAVFIVLVIAMTRVTSYNRSQQ